MKKSLLAALSLIMCIALISMPFVVSASTAVEKDFDPFETMWYSVDFQRTDAADVSDDAYVYDWTPDADGELTFAADTDSKDTLISVTNTSDSSDKGFTYKYYPAGDFKAVDSAVYKVNGGDKYKVSVMSCSGNSATVSFFAYYIKTSATGLKGAGTYSDPYMLDDSVKNLPAVASGETLYYLLTCDKTLKYNLKVKSVNTKNTFDLYVDNNKSTQSSASGAAGVDNITPFAASGYIMFSIKNTGTSASSNFTYSLTVAADTDSKGTYEDPATLVLDTLTTAKISSICYYYTYTATETGTLSVNIESEDNWVCSVSGGAAESAYRAASDKVNPVEYPVEAGEEISLWVATESFAAGTVSFTASFNPVLETTPVKTTAPTTVATEPDPLETSVTTEPEEITTAATEPEKVTTTATEPEEITTASAPEGSVAATSSPQADVTAPVTEPEEIITTASTEPSETTPSTDAIATDPEGAFVDINEDYCLSVTPLQLGANEIIVSNVYPATLFEFTPEEFGQYKFTADDANAIVGVYAGTVNYIPDSAKGTSNVAELAFSSGRDIIVAVSGTSACTLTIEKTGDVEIKEEDPWTVYENKVVVTPFETNIKIKDLTNVMIYDDVANRAVLGADGFYHLDSADGEILYFDLNSYIMSFIDIVDNSKLCAVFYDEDGNVTEKIDFTAAVLEYINNAAFIDNEEDPFYLYPLTADLIEMCQVVGEASDWYGKKGWVGGIAEDAWMFACYYEEGVTADPNAPQEPVVTPGNPSAVPTGRSFTVVYVAAALMLAAAAVVFVARKKSYR